MHSELSWDDLLYLLHVGRKGSLSGAARALGVNHSTVFRRIGMIEQKLGVRLFDRHRDGYVATPSGEEAIKVASGVHEQVVSLERKLAGQDLRPSGIVRLTTTDTLIEMLVPLCARFRGEYPEICIELVTGNEMLDLSRRDADVAVRPSAEPPEDLHGRRIGGIALAPYVSEGFAATMRGGGIESAHQWVGIDDSLSHLGAHKWLRENVPPDRVIFRASSFLAARRAAMEDMGAAVLPCYMGDRTEGLQRLADPMPELGSELWLLVHNDLRRTARVRALLNFLGTELPKMRNCFEGVSGGC